MRVAGANELGSCHFPILINWTPPFPIFGLLGGSFHFYLNFLKKRLYANSGEPDQKPRFAASVLVMHCLPISHKNARLI